MAFQKGTNMSDEEKRIKIVIEGADEGASTALKDVGSGLSGILEVAAGIISADVITKAFDIIASGVTELFNAAVEEETITTLLYQGVEHLGEKAAMSAPEMIKLAESLGQTTKFSNDLYLEGENLLMRFTEIGEETFPRVVQSAADLSTATGMDLPNAMRMLGRTLENPTAGMMGLRRMNIVLTEAQKDQVKSLQEQGKMMEAQAVILDAVDAAYGGAAEAIGGTFAGQQAILKNNMESLAEVVGGAFLPAMTGLNKIFNAITTNPQIIGFFENIGTKVGAALEPVAKLTETFITGFSSGGISGGLSAVFNPITASLSDFISTLSSGALGDGIANLRSFFGSDWSASLQATQGTIAKVTEYFQFLLQAVSTFVQSNLVPFLITQFEKFTAWLSNNQPLIDQFIVVINKS